MKSSPEQIKKPSQILIERMLRAIYDLNKKNLSKPLEFHKVKMQLGELGNSDSHILYPILDYFKEIGLIKNLKYTTEIIPVRDYPEQENSFYIEEDTQMEVAIFEARPASLKKYAKDISKLKKDNLELLSEKVVILIKLLNYYATDVRAVTEEHNVVYIELCKDIEKLLKDDLLYEVKKFYKLPFSNLFFAEKESEKANSSIKDANKALIIFLNEISNLLFKHKVFLKGSKDEADIDAVLANINYSQSPATAISGRRVVTQRDNDFYYGDKKIDFSGTSSLHYHIVSFLFYTKDGSATYESINKYLESKNHEKCQNKKKIVERITNGVKALLEHTSLDKSSDKGIIETNRGVGLKLSK